jgi:hypothetical protein
VSSIVLSPRAVAAIRLGVATARAAGWGRRAAILATACGWRESQLGIVGPSQFAPRNSRGVIVPSFNWGACTYSSANPQAGRVLSRVSGTDLGSEGQPISQVWARFASLADGFAYWSAIGSIRRSRPFYEAGDTETIAQIMYDGGYYTATKGTREDRIRNYAWWLRDGAEDVERALRGDTVQRIGVVAALGVAGLAGLVGFRFYKGRALLPELGDLNLARYLP